MTDVACRDGPNACPERKLCVAYGLVLHENREVGGLSSPLVNKFSERADRCTQSGQPETASASRHIRRIRSRVSRAIGGRPRFPAEPSRSKTSESPCDARPQPFAA